jgi:hypothetical protein
MGIIATIPAIVLFNDTMTRETAYRTIAMRRMTLPEQPPALSQRGGPGASSCQINREKSRASL